MKKVTGQKTTAKPEISLLVFEKLNKEQNACFLLSLPVSSVLLVIFQLPSEHILFTPNRIQNIMELFFFNFFFL